MTQTFTSTTLAAFCSLLCSSFAFGQSQYPSPWVFSLSGAAAHQSSTDLANTDTEFSRDRVYLSAGADYGWSKRDSVGIRIGGGSSNYEFASDSQPGDASPWSKIQERQVSFNGRFGIGQKGSLIVLPSLRQYGEKGASSSESQTYGLLTAAFWQVSDTLTIGPGIGVFSRLEESTSVFPILAIDWDVSERWNLSTGRGLAATRGPGLTLSYQINPAWSLDLSGRYEEFEFRLDDEGIAPGGVGSDKSIPVVVSTRYEPSKKLSFSAFIGAGLDGRLRLRDESGNDIQEDEYETALLLGATLSFRY
jgi:hypothetical protein